MSAPLPNFTRRPGEPGRRGFTLIESALATVIVGIGVVAMLQLLAAGNMSSRVSNETTMAMNLARSIHELTLNLAFDDPQTPTNWGAEESTLAGYDDLDDLDGASFSPPIDARRQTLSSLTGWSQAVRVESVDPDRLTLTVPTGSTRAARITVTISHHGRAILDQSWLAFDTQP